MYKFNGGNGAVVCDGCSIIMEQNIPFEKYRKEHSGYDFCEQCLSNLTIVDNFDMIENILSLIARMSSISYKSFNVRRMVISLKLGTMVIELLRLTISLVKTSS
jgi:hypothetical protein